MPIDHFLKETRDTIVPFMQTTVARVAQIPPLEQIQLGYRQFFNALALWDAPLTKKMLAVSVYTNLINYILPIFLYRRAIDTLKDYSPSATLDCMIDVADYLIISTVLMRLYVRRLWDNTLYTASLPRAIASDHQAQLVINIENAAHYVSLAVFETHGLFLKYDVEKACLQTELQASCKKLFTEFFLNKTVELKAFSQYLTPALKKILHQLRTHQKPVFHQALEKHGVDSLVAAAISNSLAGLYAPEYQQDYETSLARIEKFYQAEMKFFVPHTNPVQAFKKILDAGNQAGKLFFPIKHQPACGCNLKKILHAGVSSPVYYAANQLYITIPEKLHHHQMISDNNYFYLRIAMTTLAILIYGQGLNEYKVSPEDNCTRHRYEVFARNYFHSLGVGLGFYLALQATTQGIQMTTGVQSFFIQDGLANMLMQFGVVSMLAFNDALPSRFALWDFFAPLREVTSSFVGMMQRRLSPPVERTDARDSVIGWFYNGLASDKFRYGVDLILTGNEFLPRRELLQWGSWHDDRHLTHDPRRVIFDNQAFKQFYDLFKRDVENAIEKIKIAHYCSTWLSQPLLTTMHMAGGLFALIVDIMQLMKDDCLNELIKSNKLDQLLLFYRRELAADEATVTIDPADVSPDEKVVAAKTPLARHGIDVIESPLKLVHPKPLRLRISPLHFSAPAEPASVPEVVITHSSSSPTLLEDYARQPEQSESEDFTLIEKPRKKKSILIKNGMWGLQKIRNVVQQTQAGDLLHVHTPAASSSYR